MSGEDYNNDTNTWNPHLEQGYSPVFNGRYSGLMDLIWSCWSDDIKVIYKLMQSNGFNAKDMFAEYLSYWKQLCENIYNADAMGYVNTNNFEKAYGDKLQLSKYFYNKRFRYLDSKYCCGQSIVNNLRLRLYENGKGIAIKHYSPMYASVQWGSNNFVTKRSIDGDYALIPFGFSNPQNATFDIDDCDMITDIKTYTRSTSGEITYYGFEGFGNFYFDANMGLCTSLTEFIMKYSDILPNTLEEGTSFDLSKMTLLKKIIVTNVKNLRKVININSEICEEIDFTGSGILGVKSLPNQYLKKLSLPASITELNLTGFTSLQASDLVLAGINNVNKFVYYDCPNIDFATMLVKLAANGKLKFIEAKNIDLTITDKSVWDILINSNADLQGKITFSGFTLSFEDKVKAVEKWGNIDDNSNKLHIVYNIINCIAVEISGDSYIQEVADSKYFIYATPISANNISSVSWSITENPYATINPKTGQLYVTKISSTKDDTSATATIKADVVKSDGSVLKAEFNVGFYKRTPKMLDIVYSDGSISDKVNKRRSIIGAYVKINNVEKCVVDPRINRIIGLSTTEISGNEYSTTNDSLVLDINYRKYKRGELVSRGKSNTIHLMALRDRLLNSNGEINLPENSAAYNTTHIEAKYYPAISAAYFYEPNIANLHKKFKKENWYLGSVTDINTIYKALKNAGNDVRDKAAVTGLSTMFSNMQHSEYRVWSSSENSSERQYNLIRTVVEIWNKNYYNAALLFFCDL